MRAPDNAAAAFEETFRVGQKPVDADTIAEILAPDLVGLEARLMRNGYNVKLLTEMLEIVSSREPMKKFGLPLVRVPIR